VSVKEAYFFGSRLARVVDFYAFPRTGSHFFRYCTQGLFDLVAVPGPAAGNREAIDRQNELDPEMLYALDLREDGVPYAPVLFNGAARGQHGTPAPGPNPIVILSREPVAAAYSFYRVARDRPGFGARVGEDSGAWLAGVLTQYHDFLVAARGTLAAMGDRAIVIRYEELRAGPAPLHALVALVGVRPKLRPELVHKLTRFETFTKPGERTFYRAGDDAAWRSDAAFVGLVERVAMPDFSEFAFVAPTTRGRAP
jgi:hypothetical protein